MIEVLILLFCFFILLFCFSIYLKDNSIVDVFWGLGFIIICIYGLIDQQNIYILHKIVFFLILLWGLRLSGYILFRRIKKGGEDFRYKQRRDTWKYFYIRSFFQIYVLQYILMLLVAIPLFIIFFYYDNGYKVDIYFVIGGILSFIGFLIETIADIQLYRFSQKKKSGEFITTGLFRYSRHPNYFGESVFWLGISLIGLSISYLSLIGFFVITFLLVFVSGIPMLEEKYKNNKDYQLYKQITNAFVMLPWKIPFL